MPASVHMPTLFGRASVVLREHAELRATLGRLRELCILLGDADVPAELDPYALLEQLRAQMLDHFAAEEADDYFGAIALMAPAFADRIAQLEDQHWELIEAAARIQGVARSASSPGRLATELKSLFQAFEAHEQAEATLVRDLIAPGVGR